MNDLRGLLFLMLFGLPLIATVNFECRTHFKCLDETHFHICVDFGDGILRTIDTVVFPCPPQMICDETNKNECHLPIITTTTQMSTLAAVNEFTGSIIPDTSTLVTTSSFENNSILLNSSNPDNASVPGSVSTDTSTQAIVLQNTQKYNHTKIQDFVNTNDTSTTTEILGDANDNDIQAQADLNQTVNANHYFTPIKLYDNVNKNDSDVTKDLKNINMSSTTAEPNNATIKNIISFLSHHNSSTEILVNTVNTSTTKDIEHKNISTRHMVLQQDDVSTSKIFTLKKPHDVINSSISNITGESYHSNENDPIALTTETTVSVLNFTKSYDSIKVKGTKSNIENEENLKRSTIKSNKPTEATLLTTTYISGDSDLKNKLYMRTPEENKEIDITYATTDILIESNTLTPSDVGTSSNLDHLPDSDKTKNIENKLNDKRNDTDVINVTFDTPIETTTNTHFLTFENKKDSVNFDEHSEKSKSIDNSDTLFVKNKKNTTEHKPGNPLNSSKQNHKPFTSIGKTNGVRYTTTNTPNKTTMLMTSYFFDYYKNDESVKTTNKGTTEKTIESTVAPDLKDAVDAISVLLLNTTDSMDESKSYHNVIDGPHIMTEVPTKEILIKSGDRVKTSKIIILKENQQIDKTNMNTSNATDSISSYLITTNDHGHVHTTNMSEKTDVTNMITATVPISNVDLKKINDTAKTTDTITIDETSTVENGVNTLLIENTTQRSSISSNANDTISVMSLNTNNSIDKRKFKHNSVDITTEVPTEANMFNNSIEIFDFVKSEKSLNESNQSTIKEKSNIIYTLNGTDTMNSYLFKSTKDLGDAHTTDTSAKIGFLNMTTNTVDFIQLHDNANTTGTISIEETMTTEKAFLNSKVDTLIEYTTQHSNISSNETDTEPSKLVVVINSSSQSYTSKTTSTTNAPNETTDTVPINKLNISKSDSSSNTINKTTTTENTISEKSFLNSKVDERTENVMITTHHPYITSLNQNIFHTIDTTVTDQSRSEDNMVMVTTTTAHNALDNLITQAATSINSAQNHVIYNTSSAIYTKNIYNESLSYVSTISYRSTEKNLEDVDLRTGTNVQVTPAEVKIKLSHYSVKTEAPSTNAAHSYGMNNRDEKNMNENDSHVNETKTHLDAILTTATDLNKSMITTTTKTTTISSTQPNDVINDTKENFTNIPITSTEKHYIPVVFEPDRTGSSTTAKLQDPSEYVVFSTEKTIIKDNIRNINRTSIDNSVNIYTPSTRVPKTNEKSLKTDLENIFPTTMNLVFTENYNTVNSISPIDEQQYMENIINIYDNNTDIFSKASTGFQEQTTVSQSNPYETTETITINAALEKNVYETTTRTDSYNYIITKNERMTEGYPKSSINVKIKKILNDMNSTSFPTEKTAFESRQQLNSAMVIDFVNKKDVKNGKNTTSIVNNNVGNASDSTNKPSSLMERTTDIINVTVVPPTHIHNKMSIDPQFLLPSIQTSFHENREDNLNSTHIKLGLPTKIDIGHSESNTIISIQTSSTKPNQINVTTTTMNHLNITDHTKSDTSYASHLDNKPLTSHAFVYKQPISNHEKDNTGVIHNISDAIGIIDKSGDNQTFKFNTLDLQNSFIEHESKQYSIIEKGYKKQIDQPVTENVHDITPKIQANIVEPPTNGLITTTEGSNNKTKLNIFAKLTPEKHMKLSMEVRGNTSSDGIDITEAPIVELHDVTKFKDSYNNVSGKSEQSLSSHLPKTNISEIAETETRKPQSLKSITEFECVTEGRFCDTITSNYYYICVKNGGSFVRFKFGCQKGYHVNKLSVKCQQNEAVTVQYTATTQPPIETNTTKNVPNHPTSKNSTGEIESEDDDIKETGNLEIVEITEANVKLKHPNNVSTMITDSEVVINTQYEEDTEYDEELKSSINPNKSIQSKLENIEPTTTRLPKQEELSNVEIFANNLNTKTKHDMPIVVVHIDTLQLSTTKPIGNLKEQKVEGAQLDPITVTKISPEYITTSTTESVKPTITYQSTTVPTTGNTMLTKPATSMIQNETNFVCPDKKYTKYADNHDCRKVYVCAGKIHPIITECPTGTVFSDLKKQCTKILSHCIRNNEFQCPSEGRFHDILSNIYYYICVKNSNHFIRYKLRCKKGYHVNESTLKCELNKESIEQSSISQSSIESSEKSTASIKKEHKRSTERQRSNRKEGSSFKCVKEGKFPDPNNCRKYYVCSKKDGRNRKKRKRCKRNEVFNKEKLRCVKAESHKCY